MADALRVVVVGGGAREHALAWRLQTGAGQAPRADRVVVVTPGNPGIARDLRCVVPARPGVAGLVDVALAERADLVVVGPEQPLVDGLVDALALAGVPAFGPTASAARLEGSKAFMKDVCAKAGVVTAASAVCTTADEVARFVRGRPGGVVVKADGLCAGKGVVVCPDPLDALPAARELLAGRFGAAGATVVVEDLLPGLELSVFGICDGERALLCAPARDHKRLLDDDRGPNTGGMGAVVPLGALDGVPASLLADVQAQVFLPVLRELKRRGATYRGVLYAGLMLHEGKASVLEFNVRLGDPEAECLLHGTDADLLPLLLDVARGRPVQDLDLTCRPSATVVAAAAGYPEQPRAGDVVTGLDAANAVEGARVYCAGVAQRGADLVTAGGRVVAATASGASLAQALQRAYAALDQVHFTGKQARRDIGRSVVPEQQG